MKEGVEVRLVKATSIRHIHAVILRFCVLLLLCTHSLPAAAPLKLEILKVGSKVYRNVTVVGVNSTDLYFTSDVGINNVKLRLLEPALQQRFNFDPKAAAELERQQEEDNRRFEHSIASNLVARAQEAAEVARKAAATSEDSLADPISEKSLLGKPGPALEVEKWLTEKPELNGKFVLLTFWEPWSIPCRKAIPELNALQKKFPDRLVIIGISGEPQKEVEQMEEPKIEFACAVDTKLKLSAAASVTSIPCALLLNHKRIVVYQGHPGFLDEKKIQALLARAPVED